MEDAIECIADHVENISAGNVALQISLINILVRNATYGLVKINLFSSFQFKLSEYSLAFKQFQVIVINNRYMMR